MEKQRDDKIEELTRSGLSARKIRERLGLTISTRRVQRIAMLRVGKSAAVVNSRLYKLDHLRPLVLACMVALGKDPHLCEVCGELQAKPCEIHHTKYEGATLFDLSFVCHGCNQSRIAKGLA